MELLTRKSYSFTLKGWDWRCRNSWRNNYWRMLTAIMTSRWISTSSGASSRACCKTSLMLPSELDIDRHEPLVCNGDTSLKLAIWQSYWISDQESGGHMPSSGHLSFEPIDVRSGNPWKTAQHMNQVKDFQPSFYSVCSCLRKLSGQI
mmetsp:Transcript_28902/g.45321  ORF Transcript_28902/g.45321 Transcript_28902/m.45321 type:complete len:148 (-) Transcript_28902:179-622(-)